MKKRIIFATGNQGKMKEIREILADTGYEIVSMKEAGVDTEIIEDGVTFEENAVIKAKAIMELTGELTLADDSGLEIDALNRNLGCILPDIWEKTHRILSKTRRSWTGWTECRKKQGPPGLSA